MCVRVSMKNPYNLIEKANETFNLYLNKKNFSFRKKSNKKGNNYILNFQYNNSKIYRKTPVL